MESFRLKNICILILSLLCAFLLLLLGSQSLRSLRARAGTERELRALYAASQLAIAEDVDLEQACLPPLTPERSEESEAELAAYLLGGEAASEDQGGGIVRYTLGEGSVAFRAGGGFDAQGLSVPAEDPDAFAEDFCRRFGYEIASAGGGEDERTVELAGLLDGVEIVGCDATLRFRGGRIVSASGSHIAQGLPAGETGEMTCLTALVRFLDYRNEQGVVCSEVTDVRCVYTLQGGELLPAWQIDANTHGYTVDCATGEVSMR